MKPGSIRRILMEMTDMKRLPYGFWLSPAGKLIPVKDIGQHADVIIDILKDKAMAVLELGWVRVVNDKERKIIFFEHGNTIRPNRTQMKVLKNLALDAEYSLVCDNTGREVDLFEQKKNKAIVHSKINTWQSRFGHISEKEFLVKVNRLRRDI